MNPYATWDKRFPTIPLSPEAINKLFEERHKQSTELFDRLQRERQSKTTRVLAQVPIQVKWRW